MPYQPLSSFYYQDRTHYDDECKKRLTAPGRIDLPLSIHGHRAFFIPVLSIISEIEGIHFRQSRILKAWTLLPDAARWQYFRTCLFDEIQFTNDIEGVQSTRREIQIAFEDLLKKGKRNKAIRFSGLVNKYNKLMTGEAVDLSTPQAIRTLYDEIILPEIPRESRPDGRIFRRESVSLLSPSQQILHQGIEGEKQIMEAMTSALSILDDDSIPLLIQTAVLHYAIGYIHPFYDGNGRLNRFISSYLLSTAFDPLISYRLSYIIKNNRNLYYKAFDLGNDTKNRGDLTPFIIAFIQIIAMAAEDILDKVTNGVAQLDYYRGLLNKLTLPADLYQIVYLLIQNRLFSGIPLYTANFVELLGKSKPTINRRMDMLKTDGFPVMIGKNGNRLTYTMDLDAFEAFAR